MNTNLPDTKLYKIGEIAKILSVSIGTLRRWERQGKITSTRTAGGHRRYNLEAVRAIKTKKEIGAVRPAPVYAPSASIQTPITPKEIQAPVIKAEPINFPFRRILKAGLLALILYGLLFTVSKTHFINKIIAYLPEDIRTKVESVIGKEEEKFGISEINTSPSVLAESVSKDLSFDVNINTNLLKDLSVGGNATVSGTFTSTGDLTTNGSLTSQSVTTGAITAGAFTGTTGVFTGGVTTGTLTTGNITSSGTLTVAGTSTLTGDATLSGKLTVAGTSKLTGDVTAGGTLSVSGSSTLSGATTVGSTLSVSGATTIGSTLNVSGATTLSSLAVTGNATFGNITGVNGVTYSFPAAQGVLNSVLTNDASGNLTWTSLAGAGGVTGTGVANQITYWTGTSTVTGNNNFTWNNSTSTFNVGGSTVLGGATTDLITFTGRVASGTSLIPAVNLGSDLGSSSLKWNNIYAANLNIDSGVTSSGQLLVTYNPTDTTFAQSSIRINVTTPSTDEQMLGIGQAGEERAAIDAEGDLTLGYDGAPGSSVPTSSNPLAIYNHGTTQIMTVLANGNVGIGITNPSSVLQVANDSASNLNLDLYNTSASTAPQYNLRKANGTTASPTTVLIGDLTGIIDFQGYTTNSGFVTGAQIQSYSTAVQSNRPFNSIVFQTRDTTNNTLTTRMTITTGGSIIAPVTFITNTLTGNLNSTFNINSGFGSTSNTTVPAIALNGVVSHAFALQITDGGTELARFTGTNKAGNVGAFGLGTTNPIGKLHVTGAVTGKALAIFDETGDQALFTASASGVTKVTINHAGQIITTDPSFLRDSMRITGSTGGIRAGGSIVLSTGFNATRTIDDASRVVLARETSDEYSAGIIQMYNSASIETIHLTSSTNNSYINAGNLGIGITNPTQKLTVQGNLLVSPNGGPTLSSSLAITGATTMAVSGNYVYVARGTSGLSVYDVSRHDSAPVLVGTYAGATNVKGVAVQGPYVYIVDDAGATDTFKILDASNPASLTLLGASGTLSDDNYYDLSAEGSYAQADTVCTNHVFLNITNPSSPLILGNTTGTCSTRVKGSIKNGKAYNVTNLPTSSNFAVTDLNTLTTSSRVSIDFSGFGGQVFVTDRYAYVVSDDNATSTLKIIDVKNWTAPSLVTTYTLPFLGRSIVVHDDHYAYISGANTLLVLDVTDPTAPTVITSSDLAGNNIEIQGEYLYALRSTTLQVIKLPSINTPALYAGALGTDSLVVDGPAILRGATKTLGGLTVGGRIVASGVHAFDSTTTTSDVMTATSSAITTGNILKLAEGGNQTFSGNAIFADIANTGGGGNAFTGNFLKFNKNNSTVLTIDNAGNISNSVNSTAWTFSTTSGSPSFAFTNLGSASNAAKAFNFTTGSLTATGTAVASPIGMLLTDTYAPTAGPGTNQVAHKALSVASTINETGGNDTNYTALEVQVTQTAFGGTANFLANFIANATSRMVIDYDGQVGVGTTNPDSLLKLSQPGASTTTFYMAGADITHGITNAAPTDVFGVFKSNATSAGGLQIEGLSDTTTATGLNLLGAIGNNDPDDSTPAVIFNALKKGVGTGSVSLGSLETAFQFKSDATVLATILGSGNIGIGVTDPVSPLTLEGDLQFGPGHSAVNSILMGNGTRAGLGGGGPTIFFGTTTSTASNVAVGVNGASGNNSTGMFFPDRDTVAFSGRTTEVMRISNAGAVQAVGIGTTNPLNLLDISSASTSTASAMIRNTSTNATISGLGIKLSSTTLDTTSHFIDFLDLNGTIIGKIQAADTTSINYAANGTDMAEYFTKDSSVFTPGDLVSQGTNGATLTTSSYDSKMIGIVSTAPSFTGGVEGPNKVLVALVGQVPVKISSSSTPINPGDYITSSSEAGKAMKAINPGYTIGKALEGWDPASGKTTISVAIHNSYFEGDLSGQIAQLKTDVSNLSTDISLMKLSTQSAAIATDSASFKNLTVTGNAVLADTVVNGKLNVGTLTLDNTNNSLDAIGTLKIQPLALGDVEFLGGILKMDTKGNIVITTGHILGNSSFRGTVVIKAGSSTVYVAQTTAWDTIPVSVTLTPSYNTNVWVTNKTTTGFLINVGNVSATDQSIDWLAIW